jgi:hypothetical protein
VKARLAALLVLAPSIALAHPGHGTTEPDTWTHYVTEPVHVGVIVLAAVTWSCALGWHRARRRSRTRSDE